jgi:hypothetical protein
LFLLLLLFIAKDETRCNMRTRLHLTAGSKPLRTQAPYSFVFEPAYFGIAAAAANLPPFPARWSALRGGSPLPDPVHLLSLDVMRSDANLTLLLRYAQTVSNEEVPTPVATPSPGVLLANATLLGPFIPRRLNGMPLDGGAASSGTVFLSPLQIRTWTSEIERPARGKG